MPIKVRHRESPQNFDSHHHKIHNTCYGSSCRHVSKQGALDTNLTSAQNNANIHVRIDANLFNAQYKTQA